MTRDLPAFDEIHVVSDLHMGGRAGFQAFRKTGRLAGFIQRLAAQRPDGRLALVLNGDIFDTLAEEGVAGWIATDEACEVVGRIARDPAFAPVWQALAGFTRQPGRRLVLVIGNHDLELALPAVQRLLLDLLAGDDAAARGRVEFSTVGGGFACTVGGARVFCTHGNEIDGWNANRYDELAALARRLNAGLSIAPAQWHPNAGTRLVKEVMNGVKRRFAWIDLLKPETSAAVGALLVLDPLQATKLLRLAGLMVSARRGGRLEAGDQLLAECDAGGTDAEHGPARLHTADPWEACLAPAALEPLALPLLGPHLRAGLDADPAGVASLRGPARPARGDDLLAIAERRLAEPRDARSAGAGPLLLEAPPPASLGERWRQRLQRLAPAEALRLALLDWLADDKSFDPAAPDPTSRRICASVDAGVDFVVAGHTHLARAIDRGEGRAYFNTGTWMRLLRLTPAVLASRESFAPAWAALAAGSLQAIDDARVGDGEPFVFDRTSAVAIRCRAAEGGESSAAAVVAELLQVEGDGRGEPRTVCRFVWRGGA